MNQEKFMQFLNTYEVSNFGRVRNRKLNGTYKFLQGHDNGQGYLCVNIYGNTLKIHSMVTHVFLGPRPDNLVVDHKDRNRTNNNINNLQYVTIKENARNTERFRTDIIDIEDKTRRESYAYFTKDNKREYDKIRRENNSEKIKISKQLYNQKNKSKIQEYNKSYREKNFNKLKEHYQSYRNENKDKLIEKGKEKILCTICNYKICKGDLARHKRTIKHQKNLEMCS